MLGDVHLEAACVEGGSLVAVPCSQPRHPPPLPQQLQLPQQTSRLPQAPEPTMRPMQPVVLPQGNPAQRPQPYFGPTAMGPRATAPPYAQLDSGPQQQLCNRPGGQHQQRQQGQQQLFHREEHLHYQNGYQRIAWQQQGQQELHCQPLHHQQQAPPQHELLRQQHLQQSLSQQQQFGQEEQRSYPQQQQAQLQELYPPSHRQQPAPPHNELYYPQQMQPSLHYQQQLDAYPQEQDSFQQQQLSQQQRLRQLPPPQQQAATALAPARRTSRHSRSLAGSIQALAVSRVDPSLNNFNGGAGSGLPSSQPWMPLSNSVSAGTVARDVRSSSFAREREAFEALSLAPAPVMGANVPGWGVPPELEAQLESMLPSGGQDSRQQPASQTLATVLPSPSRGVHGGTSGTFSALNSNGGAHSSLAAGTPSEGMRSVYDMSGMAVAMTATTTGPPARMTSSVSSVGGSSGGLGRSQGAIGFGVPVAPLKMKQLPLASTPSQELLQQRLRQPSPLPPQAQMPSQVYSQGGPTSGTLDSSSGSYVRPGPDVLGTAAQQQLHQQQLALMQQRRRSSHRLLTASSIDTGDRSQSIAADFQSLPLSGASPLQRQPSQQQQPLLHIAMQPDPELPVPARAPIAPPVAAPLEVCSGSYRQATASTLLGAAAGTAFAAAMDGPSTFAGEDTIGGADSTGPRDCSPRGPSAEADVPEAEEPRSGRSARRTSLPAGRPEEGDAGERGTTWQPSGALSVVDEEDTASQPCSAPKACVRESTVGPPGDGAAATAPGGVARCPTQRATAGAAGGPTKAGRPRVRARATSTLTDVIRLGLLPAGPHTLLVGNQDSVDVVVHADGRIECGFGEFRSLSSMALAVLRKRNPARLACDGWQEVRLDGVRMDEMRKEAERLMAREASKGN